MDLARMQAEELDARMALVRGYRNKFLTDEERAALLQRHLYAKTKVRVARALAAGPQLTMQQKREIASLL